MPNAIVLPISSPTAPPAPDVAPPDAAESPEARTRGDGQRGHIVLVDDEPMFRESLGLNLADEGFRVSEFGGGGAALDYFAAGGGADVLLLDWRMPGIDGLELLRRLRDRGVAVPVIFLTVLKGEMYEEAALAGGAVDFVEKSRSLTILLKRIALITGGLKAAAPGNAHAPATPAPAGAFYGKLELDVASHRASWDDHVVDLTLTEYNIVAMLAERAGTDITYREIYDLVHGVGFVAGSGAEGYRANVRSFIKRIRRKFREVDDEFDRIENYPGFGYRWRPD